MKRYKFMPKLLALLFMMILATACLPVKMDNTPSPVSTLAPAVTDTQTPTLIFTLSLASTATATLTPTLFPSPTITLAPTPYPYVGMAPLGARVRLNKDFMNALALSPGGKDIAVGSGVAVCLYRVEDGGEVWCSMTGYGSLVNLTFNPQGTAIAAGSENGVVIVWNTASGERQTVFDTMQQCVINNLFWSYDGSQLSCASGDGTLKTWDGRNGAMLQSIFMGSFSSGRRSPDGKLIVNIDGEQVKVWKASSGEVITLMNYTLPQGYFLSSLDWSEDSTKVLVGSGFVSYAENLKGIDHGRIALLDAQSGNILRELMVDLLVKGLALSPDGSLILAVLNNDDASYTEIRLYDMVDGGLVQKNTGVGAFGAFWLPDGKSLITSDGSENLIVWDTAMKSRKKLPLTGYIRIFYPVWSPDSSQLATISNDGAIMVWDGVTGQMLRKFNTASENRVIAWSPDGKAIASAKGHQVFIWDAQTGKQLMVLAASNTFLSAMGWSQDGRFFATLSPDSNAGNTAAHGIGLVIWDTLHWDISRVIKLSQDDYMFAWALDGKTLAVAGINAISLWDPLSGKLVGRFGDGSHAIAGFTWFPDGSRLVVGGGVWDVKSGYCLFYVPQEGDLFISTALSPDGKVLADGSNEIILRDAATGAALQSLKGYANHPYQLVFSPNGKTLASASDDGTVILWDVP